MTDSELEASKDKLVAFVRWELKHGATYEFLLKNHEEKSRTDPTWKTPTAVSSRPELEDYQVLLLEDYKLLCGNRSVPSLVKPLTPSDILLFSKVLQSKYKYAFYSLIRAMDDAYFETLHELTEPKIKQEILSVGDVIGSKVKQTILDEMKHGGLLNRQGRG